MSKTDKQPVKVQARLTHLPIQSSEVIVKMRRVQRGNKLGKFTQD